MKIGELVNNRQTLEKLRKTTVSGKLALKLHRALKPSIEQLKEYDELRNEYILQHGETGKNGQPSIIPGTDAFTGYIAYVNEISEEEAHGGEATLSEKDLESVELTVDDVGLLYDLGVMTEALETPVKKGQNKKKGEKK